MLDPNRKLAQEEEDALERKPQLESETLKDLTPPAAQADGVKGGATLGQFDPNECYEAQSM